MGFSEAIKLEAKKRAHYRCCLCQTWEFVEVHHIIPQEDNGPDTLDNAAPLCVRCHDAYGGNPDKRKWTREKRDFWWDFCSKKLQSESMELFEGFSKIVSSYESRDKTRDETISALKGQIVWLTKKQEELSKTINDGNANQTTFAKLGSVSSAIFTSVAIMSGSGTYVNFDKKEE